MHPAKFEDYFKIIFATKEFAKQLNCIVGTPLLEVTQTVLTPDNSIIYVNKQYIDVYKRQIHNCVAYLQHQHRFLTQACVVSIWR